jgi:saccharopine dehydrogenase-like NADP-dependent oxidoreductase
MRVLIIGCGYVGMPLGAELVRREVLGLRPRTGAEADFKAAGVKPLTADITKAEQLAKLPGGYDWVVNCVSASGGGANRGAAREKSCAPAQTIVNLTSRTCWKCIGPRESRRS